MIHAVDLVVLVPGHQTMSRGIRSTRSCCSVVVEITAHSTRVSDYLVYCMDALGSGV